jgi:hypothetical protein
MTKKLMNKYLFSIINLKISNYNITIGYKIYFIQIPSYSKLNRSIFPVPHNLKIEYINIEGSIILK